jgi:hypothetical protein
LSRSRKKPIIKDNGNGNRWKRRQAHKMMRQSVRAHLYHGRYDVIPTDESEFVNDFDILDYKWDYRWEPLVDRDEWAERAARK